MKSAVFLDRDGVINDHRRFVNTPGDLYLFEGVGEAIHQLNEAGFFVGVVTNQGGVGLGYISEGNLAAIHAKMIREVETAGGFFDDIAYCPHKPKDDCVCRKPKPGMLLQLAKRHGLDLKRSYMVGDRDVDVLAGSKAGCKTIFIGESALPNEIQPDKACPNLVSAVDWIIDDAQRPLAT